MAQHELQRKVPATDPGKQIVDGRDEGQQFREHIGRGCAPCITSTTWHSCLLLFSVDHPTGGAHLQPISSTNAQVPADEALWVEEAFFETMD